MIGLHLHFSSIILVCLCSFGTGINFTTYLQGRDKNSLYLAIFQFCIVVAALTEIFFYDNLVWR